MVSWTAENTRALVTKTGNGTIYVAIRSQRNEKDKPVYLVAPKEYLGKKVGILDVLI